MEIEKWLSFIAKWEIKDNSNMKATELLLYLGPVSGQVSAANIEMITLDERKPLAKDAICSALHCPLGAIA